MRCKSKPLGMPVKDAEQAHWMGGGLMDTDLIIFISLFSPQVIQNH